MLCTTVQYSTRYLQIHRHTTYKFYYQILVLFRPRFLYLFLHFCIISLFILRTAICKVSQDSNCIRHNCKTALFWLLLYYIVGGLGPTDKYQSHMAFGSIIRIITEKVSIMSAVCQLMKNFISFQFICFTKQLNKFIYLTVDLN